MLGTDPLKKAVAEIQKLTKARVDLETRKQKAIAEMAELRASLPARALAEVLGETEGMDAPDGAGRLPGTTPSYNRLTILDLEVKTCSDALPELFPRLEAALRARNKAKAAEIRKKADALSVELSGHRTKVEKLQEQLWSLEGVQFAPVIFPQGHHGTGDGSVPFLATKTMTLTQERDALLAKADQIERLLVNQGGSAEGTDLESLLAAVSAVEDIAPTPTEITTWFQDALADAEAKWNGTGRRRGDPEPPSAELPGIEKYRTLSVSLLWLKDGVIDIEHSTVRYSNRFEIPREVAMEYGAEYPAVAVAD